MYFEIYCSKVNEERYKPYHTTWEATPMKQYETAIKTVEHNGLHATLGHRHV